MSKPNMVAIANQLRILEMAKDAGKLTVALFEESAKVIRKAAGDEPSAMECLGPYIPVEMIHKP